MSGNSVREDMIKKGPEKPEDASPGFKINASMSQGMEMDETEKGIFL